MAGKKKATSRSKKAAKTVKRKTATVKTAPNKSASKKRAFQKRSGSRGKSALPANAIRLPKMQKTWFDADRSLEGNSLLKNQVEHFHELEQGFPKEQRSGIPLESIETEGQAADYIRRVTLLLHRHAKPQAQGG